MERGTLAALVVILVLIAAGLWLSGVIGGNSRLQDCVASGRTNCAPVN